MKLLEELHRLGVLRG
ncbi:hypothetical protein A2U01_0116742, partial [Trifolium medium]|nr:hypothetical protein [Trifolium medium]